jgi:phage shock protein E
MNATRYTALHTPGSVFIDVREPYELVSDGYVREALNIPVSSLASVATSSSRSLGWPSTPIVVFCRSGNRSSHAARILRDIGYSNVVNAGTWEDVARALAAHGAVLERGRVVPADGTVSISGGR